MGQIPPTYVPTEGEMVYARRDPVEKFSLALIYRVGYNKRGWMRLTLFWLESDKEARNPYEAGAIAYLVVKPWPPMVKKYDKG